MPNDSVSDRGRLEEKAFSTEGLGESKKGRTEEVSILSIPKRDRWIFVAIFLLSSALLHSCLYSKGRFDIENITVIGNIALMAAFSVVVGIEAAFIICKWLAALKRKYDQRVIRDYLSTS